VVAEDGDDDTGGRGSSHQLVLMTETGYISHRDEVFPSRKG